MTERRARSGVMVIGRIGSWLRRDPLTAFLLLASIAIAIAFALLLGSTQPESRGGRTGISEVLRLSDTKQVRSATILDYDHRIVLRLRDGRELWAQLPSGGGGQAINVADRLNRSGALVDVDGQSGKEVRRSLVQYLLPILLLVCLFSLFMRLGSNGGGGGSVIATFSRWSGRARKPEATVGFAQVAGAGEAVAELREICDYLADPERYARIGAHAPRGVLLVGPPGTGKTLLGRATAGESNAAFFSLAGSEFVESLVGVGAARVRDLFEKARREAPAIIFIDELDAAGRKRGAGLGQGNDEREQTLNQLLVEMDGFDGDTGIVVMGATNRPDILDPALLRPGRFDRHITVDVPDLRGRTEILELYLAGRPTKGDGGVEAADIALLCPGFTGADLASVVNEASLLAVRKRRFEIERADLEEAIERVIAGPARHSHVLTKGEREAIAIHEASHVVVARALGRGAALQKVSIVARGRRMGASAQMLGDRDRSALRESDLLRRLIVTMAGAAGERLAFGEHATTVHDDLHSATQLARSMVTSYGMSALGPVTIGEQQAEVFLGASLQELGSVGPRTLEQIDTEVRRLVEVAERRAGLILSDRWKHVERLADALDRQETLSGEALAVLVADVATITLDELEVTDG